MFSKSLLSMFVMWCRGFVIRCGKGVREVFDLLSLVFRWMELFLIEEGSEVKEEGWGLGVWFGVRWVWEEECVEMFEKMYWYFGDNDGVGEVINNSV